MHACMCAQIKYYVCKCCMHVCMCVQIILYVCVVCMHVCVHVCVITNSIISHNDIKKFVFKMLNVPEKFQKFKGVYC